MTIDEVGITYLMPLFISSVTPLMTEEVSKKRKKPDGL